jgi:hypothetical protein
VIIFFDEDQRETVTLVFRINVPKKLHVSLAHSLAIPLVVNPSGSVIFMIVKNGVGEITKWLSG